ncbi:MAG: glycosyltransferase family 4 protein [Cyclobacteriaceae bacterium]
MRIIHLSYSRVRQDYSDPWAWFKFLSFFTGVLEAIALYSEVIAIYHINYKGVIHHKGVTYHFPKFNQWQLLLPFKFNRYIRSLHPDVVVVHGLTFPWQIVILRWQVGRHLKIIAQHHAEPPLRDIRQYIQRLADRYIKAYLFTSVELGLKWVEMGQISDVKKIKEIMGTSSPFYPIEKERARSITKVSGERVYLWVGRLDANKDPLVVAKAFVQFMQGNPEARLYFIYQTFELLEELRIILAGALGANNSIHLIGKVPNAELQYWYNSADFIISSSHYEGSGVAVCEAMSCGCIPLLTNIPSFRAMTDGGRIGLLYEAGNVVALLTGLRESLRLNQENEKKKVLERFKNEFSFEANARKLRDVINEIEDEQ